jgi:endonuclease/exonuclease/phosphatase (EEP) superfamily protein YafD
MLPIVSLLALVPGLGGLVDHARAWLIELVAWIALAVAVAVAGAVAYERVYDRGVTAEHGHTLAAQAERDTWKARALQAEATASDNEASALALGQSLTDQADAFDKADAQAHADAGRYTEALDAARRGRCEAAAPTVPDAVHQALSGRAPAPEDAGLPESFKAAERALRKARHR